MRETHTMLTLLLLLSHFPVWYWRAYTKGWPVEVFTRSAKTVSNVMQLLF